MQRHILLIVAIGVAVLIGGSLLVPRGEEHVTMLARDGLYDTASRELSALRDFRRPPASYTDANTSPARKAR